MKTNFKGNRIEANGQKGLDNRPWRRSFRDEAAMEKWAEANDASIFGTRETDEYYEWQRSNGLDSINNNRAPLGGK